MASNTSTTSGAARQHQSPWLFMDAANTIFQVAKRRCYVSSAPSKSTSKTPVIDLADDDDAWEALDDIQGTAGKAAGGNKQGKRKKWVPNGMEPVLEELPKWGLLADVLHEIEEEMMRLANKTTFRTS